jgi:hypothetical protein
MDGTVSYLLPGNAIPMKPCCRPGEGCNGPPSYQAPCALWRCRRDPRPEAARAVRLWERFSAARRERRPRAQRRFLRRAYQRARDRALGSWTPSAA